MVKPAQLSGTFKFFTCGLSVRMFANCSVNCHTEKSSPILISTFQSHLSTWFKLVQFGTK